MSLKEILINPYRITKIEISRKEMRLEYVYQDSIWANIPILFWFVPSIIVYKEGTDEVVEKFIERESFYRWCKTKEICSEDLPNLNTICIEESSGERKSLRRKPRITFYDGKNNIGEIEFDSQEDLNGAIESLKNLKFILISNSH